MLSKTSHVAEERVALEDEADVTLLDGQPQRILAAEHDAAGARKIEAGEDAQQRRLAGAGGAQQRHQLARLDLQRNTVQRRRVAEGLLHVLDRHVHRFTPRGPVRQRR